MEIPSHTFATKGTLQSLMTIVGNIISAAFAAFSIILISRKMGPELFGEFSAGFSLVLILNKVNDVGISLATHKLIGSTTNQRKITDFANTILKIKLTLSILLVISLLPFSQFLTKTLNFSNPYTVPISIVLGMSIVYYEYLISLLQSVHSFFKAVLANFTQSFLKFVIAGLYFFGAISNTTQIFALYIFVPLIPFALYPFFIPKWLKLSPLVTTDEAKKKIISIAKYTAITVLSLTIMENIGVLFVKAYLNDFETGILGGISRLALLFSLIGVSLTQVLNPRVSRYKIKNDIDAYLKKALVVLIGAILSFIILLPFTKILIEIILGTDYISGNFSLIILLASVFISIATVPFAALFFSFNRNKYFLITGIIQLLLTIVGNFILVPQFGLNGSVGTQLFTRLVVLLFTMFFAYDTYKKVYST